MAYCGNIISTDHHDQLYFDFDDDDESFDGMLQAIREVTSDKRKEQKLLTERVVGKFVWYHMTRGKRVQDDKSNVQITDPLGVFVPKKKRGSGDVLVTSKNNNRYSYCVNSIEDESKSAKKKQKKRRSNDTDNDDEEEKGSKRSKNKKKKVGKVDLRKLGLDQVLDFSNEIKSLISWQEDSDKDFKLRITKNLFQTDLNTHHDRLSMPEKQIKDFEGFLDKEEIKELSKPKHETDGIEVKLFDLATTGHTFGHGDHNLNVNDISVHTMRLRKWDMKNSSSYVLNSSWNTVLDKDVLKKDDIVQIYSFRRHEMLCFVLIKVGDGQGFSDGASGSTNSKTSQRDGAGGSGQGKSEAST